jgi:hypothetical protein
MTEREKENGDEVMALFEETADHDQTAEEAQQELASEGVNVSAFLSRLQTAIDQKRKDERLAWRRDAQAKRERFGQTQEWVAPFLHMARSELLAAVGSQQDVVHKNLEDQTDDDLRTLLADRARLGELKKT